MKKETEPDANQLFPAQGVNTMINVKPAIQDPNVVVGDFTYFSGTDFESHITHHYGFYHDRLIIGKFCQIASGVNFIMNGANHQMNAVSTFPFYIFDGWQQDAPPMSEMPFKGDTVVGNDVWIGQNVTVLPGVTIGDGAIIGANSTVGRDVPPYTIVAGNPAAFVRKRFDDELTELLLAFQWWNKEVSEINQLIPLLSSSDLEEVKKVLKEKQKG